MSAVRPAPIPILVPKTKSVAAATPARLGFSLLVALVVGSTLGSGGTPRRL